MIDIALAFTLDMIIGDPPFGFHPIRVMGQFIKFVENILYKVKISEITKGYILLAVTVLPAYFVPYLLLKMLYPYSIAYHIFNIAIMYFCLSLKDLRDESIRVYYALKNDNLKDAIYRVSLIVGRDTEHMDRKEIIRATVETVAENIVDGVISPLFYMFLLGASGGLAFKAVSTLDSMVGYKNEKYIFLGRPSAIADDILNFIPARLSILFISLASFFVGMDCVAAFRIGIRDRLKNPSPNSGHGEACFAGALDIQLGGINYYVGVPSVKPIIGGKYHELTDLDIVKATKLAYAVGIVTMIIFYGVSFLYGNTWW